MKRNLLPCAALLFAFASTSLAARAGDTPASAEKAATDEARAHFKRGVDPDRDHDSIPNDVDACPDEPGEKNTAPKKNGCPKAFVQDGQIKILEQVKFKTSSAVIQPGKASEEVLQAVLMVLAAHPEIKKVRVEGHTDNRGAAALNKSLSAKRAASVVKYLAAHGIEEDRLTSQGFGSERPIDANTTDAGRVNNRRVEFHIE